MNPESNLNQSTDNGLQTTAATSVVTKPNNTVIILFSILILILLASTGYLYYQNRQLKIMLARYQQTQAFPTPTPTSGVTANWKTYTNTNLGFSIEYPPDWQVTDANASGYQVNLLSKTGSVSLTWSPHAADQGNAGGCSSACNYTDKNGSYYWTLLKQLPQAKDNAGFIIQATIKDDTESNRTLITQILSTFTFLGQTIPTPTCRPRPACLDSTPRCLIPETEDMCPYSCPANGYANCQPGPDKNRTCSADAMAWYKANCPDFKGGAM